MLFKYNLLSVAKSSANCFFQKIVFINFKCLLNLEIRTNFAQNNLNLAF